MRRYSIFIMLVAIFVFLAACGTGANNQKDSVPEEDNEFVENGLNNSSEENNEENNNTSIENDTENNEDNDNTSVENDTENEEEVKITETGIYNGQADPHTIEIETADGAAAFQLTMEARDDVEHLTVGEEVTYVYTEDNMTRTIESIEHSK